VATSEGGEWQLVTGGQVATSEGSKGSEWQPVTSNKWLSARAATSGKGSEW